MTTFLAIVEHQGFAKAATSLHCSQPTVSNHIAALERELGTSLLERHRRPVELTQAGTAFLPHARALVRELDAARSSVSEVLGLHRGTVALGAYPSATATYVPRLLERFGVRYPGISVRLLEARADDLAAAARGGRIELMLRPVAPPLPTATFTSEPLWRERYRVVLPPAHALAERTGALTPADLDGQPLILTGHGELASPDHPLWLRLGRYPAPAHEVTQPQSLIELVRSGQGIGVTNDLSLSMSVTHGLEIRDIDDESAVRDVAVWWLAARSLSPAARALLTFMRDGPKPAGVLAVPADDKEG